MSEKPKTVALATDFNRPICGLDDMPIQAENDGLIETLRLGEVCCNALMAQLPDDAADGIVKLSRFNLARKIKNGVDDDFAAVALSSKQKTMLLDMCARVYSSLVYGRVHEALEGTTETEEV